MTFQQAVEGFAFKKAVKLTYQQAFDRTSPDTSAIAFWFPNDVQVSGQLTSYVVTVDELEERISFDIFPGLSGEIEDILKSNLNVEDWSMTEGRGFNSSGEQCLGIASSIGSRCGNFTSNDNPVLSSSSSPV